jgi:hypothetical protein
MPGAIHFSGHGLTAGEIKKDNQNNQGFTMMTDEDIEEVFKKGDAIVMEDDRCLA